MNIVLLVALFFASFLFTTTLASTVDRTPIILGNATLYGFDPQSSNFLEVSSQPNSVVQSFARNPILFSSESPTGPAIYGPTTRTLLTTSRSIDTKLWKLCEWNSTLTTPLRCSTLGFSTCTLNDLVLVAGGTSILASLSSPCHSVIVIDYVTFNPSSYPWMSSLSDPYFLDPTAMEYDASTMVVYIALKYEDSIRRYTSTGVAIDSAGSPWISIPQPTFMILSKNSSVPSLYVLTGDMTLPELYRFRISDGASISTVANEDGDWFTSPIWAGSSPSAIRAISIDSATNNFYALFEGQDFVYEFSLSTAVMNARFFDFSILPNSNSDNWFLVSPVALVRDESTSSEVITSIVDAKGWRSSNSYELVFDMCTPGMTSGATLGGSSVLGMMSCPGDTTLFIAYDAISIYRLYQHQSLDSNTVVCFDRYLFYSPIMGDNSSIVSVMLSYDGSSLLMAQNNGTTATELQVFTITTPCATSPLPQLFSYRVMPAYTGSTRFAMPSGMCMLHFSTTPILICSDGTFKSMGTGGGTPIDESIVIAAAWDNTRNALLIAFTNGSVLVISEITELEPKWHMIRPIFRSNSTIFEEFFYDTVSGYPSWITSDVTTSIGTRQAAASNARSYFWVTAMQKQGFWNRDIYLLTTVRSLGNFTSPPSWFSVSGSLYGADSNDNSRCSLFSPKCGSWMFWASMSLALCLLVIIITVASRKTCKRHTSRRSYGQVEETEGSSSSDYPLKGRRHLLDCKSLRNAIASLCCFCNCCYDSKTGYLRCCFSLIGAKRSVNNNRDLSSFDGHGGFVNVDSFSVGSEEDRKTTEALYTQSEPYLGALPLKEVDLNNTLQLADTHNKK